MGKIPNVGKHLSLLKNLQKFSVAVESRIMGNDMAKVAGKSLVN